MLHSNSNNFIPEGLPENISQLLSKINEKTSMKINLSFKSLLIEYLEKLKLTFVDLDKDYATVSKLFEIVFNEKLTEEQQNEYLNDVEHS